MGLLGHTLHILCSWVGVLVYLPHSIVRPCALTRNLVIAFCAALALLCVNSLQI